jgi:hypothetical protein
MVDSIPTQTYQRLAHWLFFAQYVAFLANVGVWLDLSALDSFLSGGALPLISSSLSRLPPPNTQDPFSSRLNGELWLFSVRRCSWNVTFCSCGLLLFSKLLCSLF